MREPGFPSVRENGKNTTIEKTKKKFFNKNMRILKRHSLLKPATDYVIDSPQPSNISYWWNIGSLLGLSLMIQIITGVTLAMHYNPNVLEAFNSVEHKS